MLGRLLVMMASATTHAAHAQTTWQLSSHHNLIEDHRVLLDPFEEIGLGLLQCAHELLVELRVVDHALPNLLEVRVVEKVCQATCAVKLIAIAVIVTHIFVAVSTCATSAVHLCHLGELLGRDRQNFECHIRVTFGKLKTPDHVFTALTRDCDQVGDCFFVLRRLCLGRLRLGGLRLDGLGLSRWLDADKRTCC
jgi:hypothetical protein